MDDAAARDAAPSRQVPARSLPIPRTVSAQLARSIAALTAAPAVPLSRAPATAEEWRAFVAANDAQTLAGVPIFAERYPHVCALGEIAGVTVRDIMPANLDPSRAGQRLVHFHGGGYTMNGGEASTSEAVLMAYYSGLRVISVDYRMPPDHPFPAGLDDAVAVWGSLLAERPASAMAMLGTSAGGGLTLATVLRLKALGLPLPAALAPSTPWTDLTGASDSYRVNEGVDAIFTSFGGVGHAMAALYAAGTSLNDPLISPVNGDFTGFPPTILTTGTRDLLLSDTVRAYRAMRAAGVDARLEVHEGMSHAEYIYADESPESAIVFGDIAAFFAEHLQG
jgi:monoterpene epsilon-lactone hydrolase